MPVWAVQVHKSGEARIIGVGLLACQISMVMQSIGRNQQKYQEKQRVETYLGELFASVCRPEQAGMFEVILG